MTGTGWRDEGPLLSIIQQHCRHNNNLSILQLRHCISRLGLNSIFDHDGLKKPLDIAVQNAHGFGVGRKDRKKNYLHSMDETTVISFLFVSSYVLFQCCHPPMFMSNGSYSSFIFIVTSFKSSYNAQAQLVLGEWSHGTLQREDFIGNLLNVAVGHHLFI